MGYFLYLGFSPISYLMFFRYKIYILLRETIYLNSKMQESEEMVEMGPLKLTDGEDDKLISDYDLVEVSYLL